MSRFDITPTELPGVLLLQRSLRADSRGFLARLFCAQELADLGWHKPVAQVNHTVTHRRGTVRGLHYQRPPQAEMKLVSCVRGAIWDVVVDLRQDSPSFLRWHGQIVSADNAVAVLVPEGCAHGFQSLSEDAELVYCHSMPYEPSAEDGIHPLDARLAIAWPLPVASVSERDATLARLDSDFAGLAP